MKVLALDLGSTLGYCSGQSALPAKHGFKDFRYKAKGQVGFSNESFADFFNWLHPLANHVDVIVCEKPIMVGAGGIGSFHAHRVLFGMYGIVQAVAGGWQKSLISVTPTEIKKFWTGSGRADKNAMILHAANRGKIIKDHNECDAVAAYTYFWEVLKNGNFPHNQDGENESTDAEGALAVA